MQKGVKCSWNNELEWYGIQRRHAVNGMDQGI